MDALGLFAVMADEAMVVSKLAAEQIRDLPLVQLGGKFPPELIEAIKEMQAAASVFLETMATVDRLASEALRPLGPSKIGT